MTKALPRNKVADLRGIGKLAVDAIVGLTEFAENLHHNIARASAPLAVPVQAPMDGLSGLVYRSVRGATRVAGSGIDLLLGEIASLLAHEPSSTRREAVLAALNGVLGDHLALSANPLAIPMRFRRGGMALGVECYAVAASIAARAGSLKERLLGDGLVPLESALGRHAAPDGGALFPPSHQSIAYGTNHLGLLDSKQVYRSLKRWLP